MGSLELLIEVIVAGLLAVTIVYCIILDRRLKGIKQDEGAMREVIKDLHASTEKADKSIQTLRTLVAESSANLGDRLRSAEHYSSELQRQIVSGGEILSRINQIVNHVLEPLAQHNASISKDKGFTPPSPKNDTSATDYLNSISKQYEEYEEVENSNTRAEGSKYGDMLATAKAIATKAKSRVGKT